MTGSPIGTAVQSQRFHVVDALRGVAALMVLAFHLMFNSAQTDLLQASAPGVFVEISRYAAHGVAIFFVISGLVICYSVRQLSPTWGSAANFALRRQVRLDPPYYVVIVGVLLIAWAESRVPGLEARTFEVSQVLLNLVYLQGIVGVPDILAVAWTLCIEVQFYVVLMLLILAFRRFQSPDSRSTQTPAVRTVVLVLGAVSMAMPWLGWSTGPWFLGYWWMFALGMVISWVLLGEFRIRTGWIVLAAAGVWCAAMNLQTPGVLGGYWAAWATAAFLLIAAQTGFIATSVPRPLALLGAWTYSLYLVHLTVIDVVMGGLLKLGGDSAVAAWTAYVIGAIASLMAAWLLYTLVEKRSLVWAQLLKPSLQEARANTS